MKILVIANSLKSVYRFRFWMLERLVSEGHKVIIACPFDVQLYSENENISYLNIRLDGKSTSLFNNLSLILRFVRIAINVKPDLSMFYSNKPALFAPIAFKLIKTVTVSINTGFGSGFLMLKRKPKALNLIFRFFYSFANFVVVLNNSDYSYLVDSVQLDKSKVIRLPGEGIDLEEFKYINPARDCSQIKFLFVGRLITDKGIHELLKASKMLFEKFQNKFKLIIVGSVDAGHPKSIKDSEINYLKSLSYIEYIPQSDNVASILERSDVFVLPSYREGLSRSAMEACSVGRPLIVSNVPGLVEFVEKGVNGFLCFPRDHISLFNEMQRFIDIDEKLIVEMGRESHSRILNKYNIDSVYKVFKREVIQKIKQNEKTV